MTTTERKVTMRSHFLLPLATSLLTTAAFAQQSASATGNASVTLLAPIQLAAVNTLSFGEVIELSANQGTVAIAAATGQATYSSSLGTGPSPTSTPQAGSFTVTGSGNATYTVTLPSSATLTSTTNSGNTMSVGTFTDAVSSGTLGTLPAGGTQTLLVGATLTVPASQPGGIYNGTYQVTVQYQ
jgi:hypothetical protein